MKTCRSGSSLRYSSLPAKLLQLANSPPASDAHIYLTPSIQLPSLYQKLLPDISTAGQHCACRFTYGTKKPLYSTPSIISSFIVFTVHFHIAHKGRSGIHLHDLRGIAASSARSAVLDNAPDTESFCHQMFAIKTLGLPANIMKHQADSTKN